MKLRKTYLLIPAVIAVGALLVGFGRGRRNCDRDPAKMARHAMVFLEDKLDDMDATDTQRSQVKGIAEGVIGQVTALRAERSDAREQMLSFWGADKPDAKAVHAAIDQRIETLRKAAHQVADAGLKAHAVLTPTQRKEVSELIRERSCEGKGDSDR